MLIMTYNIRLGIQQGVESIASLIRDSSADIIALQEVGKFWNYGPAGDTLARLSELTGLPHYTYAPALTLPGQGVAAPSESTPTPLDAQYGHGLLSRWPIIQTHLQLLTQNKDERRVLLFATVETEQGKLQVLSTHLSHVDSDRPAQAKELVKAARKLAKTGDPVILLGDFNESPDTRWIKSLQKKWHDAGQHSSNPTFPASEPRVRIDYLMAANAHWQTDAIVIDEREASDHRPVIASLQL